MLFQAVMKFLSRSKFSLSLLSLHASTTTSHKKDDEVEVRVEKDEEVVEDCDADDSDSDHATVDSGESDSLDSLTFLRVVTTCSGRTVRVVYRMTKVTNVDIGMTFPIQM
jgi:hypothetical protein